MRSRSCRLSCFVAALALSAALSLAGQKTEADAILKATGVQGGLVVHVGCGDGSLTAALRASDAYTVHGLDTDPKNVAAARKTVQALDAYGPVSIDRWDGKRLPYVDNLVNLVVAEAPAPRAEVMRVLCPNGVAYVKQGGAWTRTVKPRPQEIDEWTHFLYDSTNNAVAADTVVGPPRRFQWLGSPRWARHHDHMASMSALVATKGRIFYILDEGSRASIVLPSKWFVIARDAFNGTVLWKRPIARWHTQLWPLKSGPALLARRLVAVGDEVYVTLGLDAPLTVLDAATGNTLRTIEGSKGTDEIIASDGVLFLAVNKDVERRWGGSRASTGAIRGQVRSPRWAGADSTLIAVKAGSGERLWQEDCHISSSTLAADAERVYFHDGQQVVCLDRTNGQQIWAAEAPVWKPNLVQSWFAPVLVIYKGTVLFAGGEAMVPHRGGKDTMTAFDAKTGTKLWSAEHGPTGYQSSEDLLVAGGLVWSGATTNGGYDGTYRGHDPRTGELKREFPPDVKAYWFHHRCHRGKATEKFLLPSRTGIEFIDVEKKTWTINHWVRGGCLYGIMPCNGLIYAPMHDCACYPEAKQYGFSVLAAESKAVDARRAQQPAERLEQGPAYGTLDNREPAVGNPSDWPTYRRSATRNGYTSAPVEANLAVAWKKPLGGRLSSVVVAEGKLYVASIDIHQVLALDAASGDVVWTYTAGGRVDSPPTIFEGRCLFGSADGYVTCLRADDGRLIWRFQAAPVDQRMMAFEQVESVWPVHGNVLVQDGVACFAAGRSMFLDGGLRLYRLDAKTGRVLSTTVLDSTDPKTEKPLQDRHQILQMPVALPDILSSDGKRLFMRSQVFDLEGKRLALGPHSGDPAGQGSVQRGDEAHLFAPYGFTDDSWFHRSYWVYGRSFSGGHGGYFQAGKFTPAGRILVADDKNVYGYARKPQYLRWTTQLEYHLFASDKTVQENPQGVPAPEARRTGKGGSWVAIPKTESQNPSGKPLAVEAWVKAAKPNGVVVARGGPAIGYALFLQGGQPRFAVRLKETVHQVDAKRKVVGKWVHLAGVLTPDKKIQLYVDGKMVAAKDVPGFIEGDPVQAMEIGADEGGNVADYRSPFPLTGLIDEVRVYYGAVTAEEIARHCADPKDATAANAKLIGSYSFDKGKARDASGSGNHGQALAVKPAEGKVGGALAFSGKGAAGGRRGSRHLVQYHWSKQNPPVIPRAMVLAGTTLFVAGPPDVLDEETAVGSLDTPEIQKALAEQDAALDGKRGATLVAVSTKDGSKLAEMKLDVPPAWDAMAAANGRLYLATVDGNVICFAPVGK